jgi:hypothetical protein
MIRVYIKDGEVYSNPIKYTLNLINVCLKLDVSFTFNKNEAHYIFDLTDDRSIFINFEFYNSLINEKKYSHQYYFNNEPVIYSKSIKNKKDLLGTVFYIVNSFQEYKSDELQDTFDTFGRFKFESSFQFKFNCIEENLVEKYLKEFCKSELKIEHFPNLSKARIFLSHDIDSLNGSFLQDGKWAVQNRRFDVLLKIIFNEMLRKPHWKNVEFINKLHDENGIVSTFFWLAKNITGKYNVQNADYNINELRKMSSFSKINGLHKSSCNLEINEELDILPFKTYFNRYHFLMFNLPNAWEEINNSNLKLDASLGFAERYGFRNSYGLPFRPYNLNTGKSYDFVEVPLNVMDGTFQKYMKIPISKTAETIICFLEKNLNNSVLSILWHNTFFTSYKYIGYLYEYQKILHFIVDANLETITPNDIVKLYGE